jgi:predicted transcriptional regulator
MPRPKSSFTAQDEELMKELEALILPKITPKAFSEMSGISLTTIDKILKRNRRYVSPATLAKLRDALGRITL